MKDLLLHAQVVVKNTNVSILRPTSAARETRLFFPVKSTNQILDTS